MMQNKKRVDPLNALRHSPGGFFLCYAFIVPHNQHAQGGMAHAAAIKRRKRGSEPIILYILVSGSADRSPQIGFPPCPCFKKYLLSEIFFISVFF
jgi:hypothetical protein